MIVRRLCSLGGEALGTLAATLFASPRFTEAFGRAVQAALEAKGRVDRNVQTVLGLLNLPSRADLARIATRLDAPQSTRNAPPFVVTWKHVLNRPPLPNASPQPRN